MAKKKVRKQKKQKEKKEIKVELSSESEEGLEKSKTSQRERVEKELENKEKIKQKKKQVMGFLSETKVITESSDDAREFYNQSRFGSVTEAGKVELSLLEALHLFEKNKLLIKSEAGRKISFESFVRKARKVEPNFWVRYCVFKDIRNRGYIIKTALKFGADFRIYDRGIKPGEDHAKWVVFPVHEGETLTWYEFAAKNRVAHSTKKRLLIGIVDDEGDVTYYEVKWTRP
jgi:tRNA-intron endonuclease